MTDSLAHLPAADLNIISRLAAEIHRLGTQAADLKDAQDGLKGAVYEQCNLQGKWEAYQLAASLIRKLLPSQKKNLPCGCPRPRLKKGEPVVYDRTCAKHGERSPITGRYEVIDPSGDTTHGLTAEEAGQWVTDALALKPGQRPELIVVKGCSIFTEGA